MSLDLLKERFGSSKSTNKKEVDKEKLNEIFNFNNVENLKEVDKEKLNNKFNSNPMGNLESFKAQHQEELEEKDRIIESLEIESTNLA